MKHLGPLLLGTRPRRAVLALVALLVHGTAALASSIVYIKDGNVWIAAADGTTRQQVTTNGTPDAPYYSPSQADDGTIAVGGGAKLYLMNQVGVLVGPPIPTLVSEKPANVYAVGPFNPRISPDGTTVAYWIGLTSGSYDPGCNCYLTSPVESIVYASADASGTIGFSRFWQTPSWIDNSHVLVFAPGNRQTPQVGVAALAALGAEQGWFNDDGEGFDGFWQNLDDGDLDRSGRKLVLVRGMQAERLSLYAVTDFATRPVLACEGAGPSGAFHSPTWSPDGRALAWYEDDGVWTSDAPAELTAPGACDAFAPRLLIPGASQPRWGVTDVSPPAPTSTLPSNTFSPTPSATPVSTATPTATAIQVPTHTTAPTPTPTMTPIETAPPEATATHTPTATRTASATASPQVTASATATAACPGDCNDDTLVTVDELVRGVNIALGNQSLEVCVAFDTNTDGVVTVDELIRAVHAGVSGCVA